MGRPRRRAAIGPLQTGLGAAVVALLAVICLAAWLGIGLAAIRLGGRNDGLSASSGYFQTYSTLALRGPNDGEPLNNSFQLLAEVRSAQVLNLVLFEDGRYESTTQVGPGQGSCQQALTIPLDCTDVPNGPASWRAYLYSQNMDRILESRTWSTVVENPLLDVGWRDDSPEGALAAVRLVGRAADRGYYLEAGYSLGALSQSPSERCISAYIETCSTGRFPPAHKTVVLNVDNLVRAHTLDGGIILWTYAEGTGWAHSAILPIRLLAGE